MQVEGVTEDRGRECGEVVKLGLARELDDPIRAMSALCSFVVELGDYRDEKGKRDLVRPAEGPAALALFRRGLKAWREEKRT